MPKYSSKCSMCECGDVYYSCDDCGCLINIEYGDNKSKLCTCMKCNKKYCKNCVKKFPNIPMRRHCTYFFANLNMDMLCILEDCKNCTVNKNYIHVTEAEKFELALKKSGINYDFLLKMSNLQDDEIINQVKEEICKNRNFTWKKEVNNKFINKGYWYSNDNVNVPEKLPNKANELDEETEIEEYEVNEIDQENDINKYEVDEYEVDEYEENEIDEDEENEIDEDEENETNEENKLDAPRIANDYESKRKHYTKFQCGNCDYQCGWCDYQYKWFLDCVYEYYLDPFDKLGVIGEGNVLKITDSNINNTHESLKLKLGMEKYLGKIDDNSSVFTNCEKYEYLFDETILYINLGLTMHTHIMKCLFLVIKYPAMNEYIDNYLETNNVDINEVTPNYKFTALHIVCELYGRSNERELVTTMNILINRGANINQTTNFGSTPLHIISYHGGLKNKNNHNVIRMLLAHGADAFEIKNRVEESVCNILNANAHEDVTVDEKNKKIIFNTENLTKPVKIIL